MSSAASRPPEFPESTNESAKQPSQVSPEPPVHPKLMGPPKRPIKSAAPEPPIEPQATAAEVIVAPQEPAQASAAKPETTPIEATATEPASPDESETAKPRQQPISPPSEPMQYRAIGLLRGRYLASEEMFNRGQIITQDETAIGAVLLGRVTSLVKKHLDMENDHLWVVYPRTNPEQGNALNVQIVGVWEPETLGVNDDEAETSEADPETDEAVANNAEVAEPEPSQAKSTEGADQAEPKAKTEPAGDITLPTSDEIESDYFSIRGEIAKYFEEKGEILVNILQKVKSGAKQQRPFKLFINGHLEGKTIGYFWDLHVERKEDQLVLKEGTQIAAVPPKKKSKRRGPGGGGGPRKRFPAKGGPPRRTAGGPQGSSSNYRSSRPTREAPSEAARADKA